MIMVEQPMAICPRDGRDVLLKLKSGKFRVGRFIGVPPDENGYTHYPMAFRVYGITGKIVPVGWYDLPEVLK